MILSRLLPALLYSGVFAGVLFGQATALPTAPTTPPPPPDPKILEDGGFSIEPIYWLTRAQPKLTGGSQALTPYQDLAYAGKSRNAYGVEIGIPAGRANTLRLSYFRVLGSANSTIGSNGATLFSEAYAAGDYIVSSYNVQDAKISWDYLSYTFKNRIRFKTLYEVQYLTIGTSISAPLIPETYDSTTGNTDTNSSTGTKNVILPTFGAEFEQPINKHLRWEFKGSGFGLPHKSVIWDAQADVALRFSSLELFAGGKAFHFKTSPNSDDYFTDTLQGAYFGIRYYLSRPTQ
jgi:hypothetical protein